MEMQYVNTRSQSLSLQTYLAIFTPFRCIYFAVNTI